MRVVIEGDPNTLRLLKKSDLPDADLRGSFFRYVLCAGFDFTGYDLRDTDFLDCKALGAKLPEGGTKFLMSRRTDWTGAQLPSDLSSYCHDLVCEAMRQAARGMGQEQGEARQFIEDAADFVLSDYRSSWQNTIPAMAKKHGLTLEQLGELAYVRKALVAKYPKIAARREEHFRQGILTDAPPQLEQPLNHIRVDADVEGGDEPFLDLSDFEFGLDRYDCARRLEAEYPRWFWYVVQLDPFPQMVTTLRTRLFNEEAPWGWWGRVLESDG